MWVLIRDTLNVVAELWVLLFFMSLFFGALGQLMGPFRNLSYSNLGAVLTLIGLISYIVGVHFDDALPGLMTAFFWFVSFVVGLLLSPVPVITPADRIGWVKDLTM